MTCFFIIDEYIIDKKVFSFVQITLKVSGLKKVPFYLFRFRLNFSILI